MSAAFALKATDVENSLQRILNKIKKQKELWWKVHKEDHEICERLQEGRASPASGKGGLLSPHWEKGVKAFQKLIMKDTLKVTNSLNKLIC